MSDHDAFGDRMKLYEMREAGRRCIPQLPLLVRLDGRSFSSLTRGLLRPFDVRLHDAMVATAADLLEEAQARLAYTQSDEITLVLYEGDPKSQLLFDGRFQKLTSCLAAYASVVFGRHAAASGLPFDGAVPTFDCRAWEVPTLVEAANAVLWRERDATKNAVSMAARCHYSTSELHLKRSREMQAMLLEKGVNFNDYPAWFKRGTFLRRQPVLGPPSPELVGQLVASGRPVPEQVVRNPVAQLDVPPFGTVTNRVEFIFEGADPVVGGLP